MMMIHLQLCGFFVVLLQCFVSGVLALLNGGEYRCSPWTTDEKVTVTFRIDSSKFPSQCEPGTFNGKPLFSMSTDGDANYITKCTVQDNIEDPGNCDLSPGTLGCGCTTETDSDYYVVEYNFIAGPAYHRWWKPSLNCLDSNYSEVFNYTEIGCQPILDATTTPATTESTTASTRVLPPDDGLDAGQIAGIVVGCVVILVIIIIIIVFILKKKKGCVGMPFSAPTDSPQPVNGHNVSAAPTSTADKPPTNTGNGSDRRQ